MRTSSKVVGLLFCALLAVYYGQASSVVAADLEGKVSGPVIDEATAKAAVESLVNNSANPPAINTPAPVVANPGHSAALTASQVSVSDAGTVEIHVNNADLLEVLRMLSVQSQKNIVASKEVGGTVTANLYNVTIHEALEAILKANGFAYRESGNFIYVYSAHELAELDKASRHITTRVFRLYYTTPTDAAAMIKPVLSADGQVVATAASGKGINTSGGDSSSGGGSGGSGGGSGGASDTGGNSYAGTDMLVVTDDQERLDQIQLLLKEIDRRPKQVLVEATILSATLNDNNALGVDFSVLGGVRFDQFLQSPAATALNAANSALVSTGTNTPAGTGVGSYGVGQTNFTSQLPPGGMRVGIVTNNLSAFVQALETVSNTTVLANPKVLAVDKQSAEVHVGSSDGYNTTTVTATTSTQTVELFDTGTTLSFRPYVGADGYIRMEIHPEDSTGGVVNGLPHKVTTEITSNVMVKDGHTIVIGGLFREQSSTSRGQIPGLGSIPYLGVLFRQQQDTTTREEIIVLLTPHIIKDDSNYQELSEDAMRKLEELRVGVRKGMMFFANERLAETAYQNAVNELNKPHPNTGLAMWHLNVATNLNPTFLEAIELKEKLSGQHVTDVDNSSIRSFVSRAILADNTPLESPPVAMDLPGKAPTTNPSNTTNGK
jgi:type IV pilus assembly protein PilQ